MNSMVAKLSMATVATDKVLHECTPSVIAYYTQPGLVYYTLPWVQSPARVHAKCNSVLHSARRRVLHSAVGPYITCVTKQMDEGFGGTQLYRQSVCFSYPLSLLTLDQHNQCKFVLKVDDKNICLSFDQ
jgi:hypothetical protein